MPEKSTATLSIKTMNQVFNQGRWSSYIMRELYQNLNTGSLKVTLAAITCAGLVYAVPLNYVHILEYLFSCIVNDPISINEYLAK